jgi:nucleoid DNA-binding protein
MCKKIYFAVQQKGDFMPSVKKSDLASAIAAETGLTIIDTKIVVDELIGAFSQALIDGNTIELRGFATFYITKRSPRTARNMSTGEKVQVAQTKSVVMKPCKTFKDLVNDSLSKKDAE